MQRIVAALWVTVALAAGCDDETSNPEDDATTDTGDASTSDVADSADVLVDVLADTDDVAADSGDVPADSADAIADSAADLGEDSADVADVSDVAADPDVAADVAESCLDQGMEVGERVPLGGHCNFCECQADGSMVCTERTCAGKLEGCEYDGETHAHGARFAATDGCNDCVCAASGLACTRRCPEMAEEGAILMESMNEACGDDAEFTGESVLSGLPYDGDLTTAFTYVTDREDYPEDRPPTTLRLRIVYEEGGYVVCRLPSPDQPAIDIEATVEWMTLDGAFDEGFHTYLRRNNFGFVDGWTTAAAAPLDGLDGDYEPDCANPAGFAFSATIYADETADGSASKVCDFDILYDVGTFPHTPD